jgi:FSR family fosmidomycin resistance protein-like MFS transporter
MYMGFLPALLPVIVDRLGLTYQGAGLLVSVVTLSSQLSQPLFGFASDRLGRRWMAIGGPLLTTVSMSWLGLLSSYEVLLIVLILGSLGSAAHHPSGAALVSDIAGRRASVGMALFAAGGTAGFGLGSLVAAAVVASLGGWSTLLTAPVGLAAVVFLVSAVPRRPGWTGRSERETPHPMSRLWRSQLTALLAVVTLRASAAIMFTTFAPILLRRRGEALVVGGWTVFCFTLAGAAGGLFGSWLAGRVGQRAVTVAGFALGAPALYLFLHTDGIARMALLLVSGACVFLALPVNIVMAQRLLPRHASTASGLVMGSAWGLGGLAATGLGALADNWAVSMGELDGLARAMELIPLVLLAGAVLAFALPARERPASD